MNDSHPKHYSHQRRGQRFESPQKGFHQRIAKTTDLQAEKHDGLELATAALEVGDHLGGAGRVHLMVAHLVAVGQQQKVLKREGGETNQVSLTLQKPTNSG